MQTLPPFAAIRAFEAAARLLSFKDAALELGVTPTAVSHQIKQLEQLSGRAMFVRRARSVELTPDGRDFAEAIAPAIDTLAAAFAKICIPPDRQHVTLGAGPIFAARWLVPRLGDFWTAHPGIDLRLHHSPLPVWQQLARFDLAIAWGKGNWPGVTSNPLLRIQVSPVMAPGLIPAGADFTTPEQLLNMPLLHHRDDSGWREWFMSAGVTAPDKLPGTVFEDANVLLQAALSGRGVALGILQFVDDDIAAGRLVQPFPTSIDPGESYFLVYRENALSEPATLDVRNWLLKA